MIRILKAFFVCICMVAMLGLWAAPERAQSQAEWAGPYRLSTEGSQAGGRPAIVADQYGYVHVFWVERSFRENWPVIQYARFDGETWSPPVDIFIVRSEGEVEMGQAAVDRSGNLYLIWTEGITGPVRFSMAPAHDALSAQQWSKPVPVDIPALLVRMQVDSQGVLHVVYVDFYSRDPGVFYLRSKDQGITWTSPYSLDPNTSPDYGPSRLEFTISEDDALHAVWQYSALLENGFPGKWIRYAGSHDGGENWSAFLIDEADDGPGELRAGSPIIAAHDQNVYVTWVGTLDVHHEYRFSTDGGSTWSPTAPFMPDLDGSAGDGLAVDGAGRLHFVGQVRYPQGLYTASFERGLWSLPSLFYLISANPSDPIGDRIHVHRVNLAVRSGNQLVAVFTDGPGEPQIRVFAMYRFLNDLPATDPEPTPAPTALANPDPAATQALEAAATQPASTPAPAALGLNTEPAPASSPPGQILIWAVFPTLLVLAGFVAFSMARKR